MSLLLYILFYILVIKQYSSDNSYSLIFSAEGEEIGYSIETHINYVDKSFSTPLHLAVRGGNLEVIKLCIEQGAKIDQQQVFQLVMKLRSF